MVFASVAFLMFFLPLTAPLYFAVPSRAWRNIVLLLASLLFYAWGEPVYIALMVASIVANWAIALLVQRRGATGRAVLVAAVTLNLAAIGVFKYADFLVENLNALTGLDLPASGLKMPIGISFYTFQAISYLVDVHRGTVAAQRNPLYFGTYLAMFPQLIAGPIVRYHTIENELRSRQETLGDVSEGLRRFAIGLGKKVLIANTMAQIANPILGTADIPGCDPRAGAIPAWFAFGAYTLQIYFDFSGYSDMAIGLGRMFGFRFLQNFAYPYAACSVTDFWRRWHISLSSFFRDYVYIPMGGNRVGVPRFCFNLLCVWALTGLWHGASWNFVCWGGYYGILLLGEKLVWGALLTRLPRFLQHAYTILLFFGGWVIFRIEDFGRMGEWIVALAGGYGRGHPAMLNAADVLHLWPWLVIGAIGSTPIVGRLLERLASQPRRLWLAESWVLVVYVWSILTVPVSEYNPFIYWRF